jgi:hypothetical protein
MPSPVVNFVGATNKIKLVRGHQMASMTSLFLNDRCSRQHAGMPGPPANVNEEVEHFAAASGAPDLERR